MSPIQPMRQIWVPGFLLGSAIKLQRFPRLRPHHSCEDRNENGLFKAWAVQVFVKLSLSVIFTVLKHHGGYCRWNSISAYMRIAQQDEEK